jgi:hypothetical protein
MPEAGITEQSFYPWKRKYMDMGLADLFSKQFSGERGSGLRRIASSIPTTMALRKISQ